MRRPPTQIDLRLLGQPGWRIGSTEATLLAAKDAALLAMLALDGPKARGTLCALLWPEADKTQSLANLRQRLSRLRKAIGTDVVQGAEVLSLPAAVQTDIGELTRLSVERLLQDGALLAGIEFGAQEELDGWLVDARAKVERQRAQALVDHAEQLMQLGELHAALPLVERIVELTPELEHAWRRLMRLHYFRGDRSAALAAFERLSARMLDELGIQPSEETLQLWQTIESAVPAKPLPQRPVPASVMLPPVMVGRTAAWQAMASAWQNEQPFVLVGEGGLGKSRLLHEFLLGREGVVQVKARPGETQTPFAVLGRVLGLIEQCHAPAIDAVTQREIAHIRPEFGQAWPTQARPEVLRHAVAVYLAEAMVRGLRCLVLDDMHEADLATLETLRWVVQTPTVRGLKLALALRPPRIPAQLALINDWFNDSQPPAQVVLQPLSQADLAALLASLALPSLVDPDVTAQLFRHAGGHPLYTLATLQDALAHGRDLRQRPSWQAPATVQTLLDTRLRELPASALPLLHVAAVAGVDLTAERAAALVGCKPLDLVEAWRQLEESNVLRGDGFTHDLVHEAALRCVPLGLRNALHRQLGELLKDDTQVAPARVAWHWEQGQRWAEAGRCWHAAARTARMAGRLTEQLDLLEQAARCHELAGDDGARFEALFARLNALLLRHGGAAVLAALPQVQALADTAQHRLQCRLARAEAWLDGEHSQDACAEAKLAVQEAAAYPALRAHASALQAMALAQCQQTELALAAAQAALISAKAAADLPQELRATNALAYVHYASGHLALAVPVQLSAAQLAERLGARADAAGIEGHIAALLASVGDVPGTYSHASSASRRFLALGLGDNSTWGVVNHIVLGAAAAYLGRFDEALKALDAAVAMAKKATGVAVQAKARLALAQLWLTLGQPQAVGPLLADLPGHMMPGMKMHSVRLRSRAAALIEGPKPEHWYGLGRLAAEHPNLPLVQSAWYELSFQGDAAATIRRLSQVRAECVALGLLGTARSLHVRELVRWLDIDGAQATAKAAQCAHALLPHVELGTSAKVYPPQAWVTLAAAFDRAGETDHAALCINRGQQWVSKALAKVPLVHRSAFQTGNPANCQLLQLKSGS